MVQPQIPAQDRETAGDIAIIQELLRDGMLTTISVGQFSNGGGVRIDINHNQGGPRDSAMHRSPEQFERILRGLTPEQRSTLAGRFDENMQGEAVRRGWDQIIYPPTSFINIEIPEGLPATPPRGKIR